jgi:probable DNA repair protein
MSTLAGAEIDSWLRDGGLVLTASARAARALLFGFHRRRRAEGLSAWPAPAILDWTSFIRIQWQARTSDSRMLLNPVQEQTLWADIAAREQHLATVLPGSLHRLAAMAMQAHQFLCDYAPRYLREAPRAGWEQDPGAFSTWLSAFEALCRDSSLLSPARAAIELIPLLAVDSTQRPALLLAGFDRLLPTQRNLLEAWGNWQPAASTISTQQVHFYAAADSQSELAACAHWCMLRLAANPSARLLVLTQDVAQRRGEIERAFFRATSPASLPIFEFSLGIPLRQVPLIRGAHLLLRWLTIPLQESELDWLFSTGQAAADPAESAVLQSYMRAIRRRGLERTQWPLEAFTAQPGVAEKPPAAWLQRILQTRRLLLDFAARVQSPLDWAAFVPRLLQSAGWPGTRRLSSAEFQAYTHWEQAVDTCGSLGFDGRRIPWSDFLSALTRTLDETLYTTESGDAPIQITGPAESAGLTADALWFLGADEDSWPAPGSMHPLLPPQIQRECGMPHATPRLDLDLAQSITTRLLSTAPAVHFSYARQKGETDARPARLIVHRAGQPQPIPPELEPDHHQDPLAVPIQDFSLIPYPYTTVEGGSSVLTSQSQCPFQAFATARLGAQSWRPAQAGLTPAQRGQLLHAVLHAIWAGPPRGLRSLDDLLALADRESFVDSHVSRILHDKLPDGVQDRMPQRYIDLEQRRLTHLITEWLDYEVARLPFTVTETEATRRITVAGLTIKLRLDRIDRLNDGSLLVIDYKTGDVSPKSWDLPRPDDVQLPLYAGFALNTEQDEQLGGLVFAKIRPGERIFAGRVVKAKTTLRADLTGHNQLVRDPLTAEQLLDWREAIEQLARDFLDGRAEVDPRQPPETCTRCGLQALCRIQEHPPLPADNADNEGASDD